MVKNIVRKKAMTHSKKIFLAVVIGFAVISFWRGVWGLMDVYLFPENLTLSLITSTILGLVILIITHYAIRELM